MVNPLAGEVRLIMDGHPHALKLTLGALAELEADMQEDSLLSMVKRFETNAFSTRDVLALIVAGLRGGGWTGEAADLISTEIEGGPVAAAQAAAMLLTRAFSVPGCAE